MSVADTLLGLASSLSSVTLSALRDILEPHFAYKSHIYSTLYAEPLFVNSNTTELAYTFSVEQEREKMIRQQRQLLSYDFRPGCEKQQQSSSQSATALAAAAAAAAPLELDEIEERSWV